MLRMPFTILASMIFMLSVVGAYNRCCYPQAICQFSLPDRLPGR